MQKETELYQMHGQGFKKEEKIINKLEEKTNGKKKEMSFWKKENRASRL